MAEILADLKRKRGGLRKRLTDFKKFVNDRNKLFETNEKLERVDTIQLETRLQNFIGVLDEFRNINWQIEAIDTSENVSEEESYEDSYFSIVALAKFIIETANESKSENNELHCSSPRNSIPETTMNSIKLPTIELPKFSGNYTKWLEFRDTFESLIHKSDRLTEIQKFYYLKSALEGDAANVIGSMENSANNYNVAWGLLCDRYENKRLLVHNHIRALFNLPAVTKESSLQIRQMLDTINQHLRALAILEQPVESWDSLIIFIVTSKFDAVTAREWEADNESNDLPTLESLKVFLKRKAEMLETLNYAKLDISTQENKSKFKPRTLMISKNLKCYYCQESHTIYMCKEFLSKSVEDRIASIKSKNLCLNCLRSGHVSKDCTARCCKQCQLKHNTLLHKEKAKTEQKPEDNTASYKAQISQNINTTYAVLSTIQVKINTNGNNYVYRALLDTGSQSNIITLAAAQSISAKIIPMNHAIRGIGNCETKIVGKCHIHIKSSLFAFSIKIECLVIPNISEEISQCHLSKYRKDMQNFSLADPDFDKPGEIDIILGNGVFWNIITEGSHKLGNGKPILQNTKFGWVLAGPLLLHSSAQYKSKCYKVNESSQDVQQQLARFWEIEELPNVKLLSEEERQTELHFTNTFERSSDGRFIVSIPFKKSINLLGNSQAGALQRFLNLERKLLSHPELKVKYASFMREYEQLKHMTKIEDNATESVEYYLPHHCVINEASKTTRLRVVFDASFLSSSGYSLNNLQCVGPVIQNDLISILLKFRQHLVVMSADISKMYRQVLIKPEERSLQKIFWRYEPTDNISTYTLNTVTYGTASASFLAVRCLHQLAIENSNKYPKACNIILNSFYVDDLLFGTDELEEASVLCKQISEILDQGCFPLRKWLSNYSQILNDLENLAEENMTLPLGDSEMSKTLGLFWVAKKDVLTFNVSLQIPDIITKRNILSLISQIFDPLGLLGPCIISIKILLQLIWLEKLNWDDTIPDNIQKSWLNFHKKLPILNQITIPRHVICNKPISIELHGFSDASEKAYGASIYIRSESIDGLIISRLLCAKAKVAPIKSLTIPRLELQAALLLAKLMHKVITSLTLNLNQINLWCDSSIVLSWLQTEPNTLKIFVSNRVVQIHELMPNCTWYYVPSEQNPADLISRGISPEHIAESTLWWNGPSWLCEKREFWSKESIQFLKEIPELKNKPITCLATKECKKFSINNYSNLDKLIRIISYCLRFKSNCLNKQEMRKFGPISVLERRRVLNILIKIAQDEFYSLEIKVLQTKGCVQNNSNILALLPYLDENHILRVSGRLQMSDMQYDEKHPIILSQKSHLTLLIFRHAHLLLLHGGVQQMLCYVRQKYWPIKARCLAKRVVRECVTCFRAKPNNNCPPMGRLPIARVNQAFPFQNTGVDYAGPFTIKNRKGRGAKSSKCYLALFVCLAVKAVHIEIVTDLSTEAFLASLRRFISRRGCPNDMYSDNATNFVGAERELGRWLKEIEKNNHQILNDLANRGIKWHFIPPRAPHFGGLWESSVKRAKFHLKRILLNDTLTFEEMYTFTCQVEAILNSRPLTLLSDDVTDIQPLTPAHFLLGRSLTTVPDLSHESLSVNPRKLANFQRVQQMTQGFWSRWKHEYLQQLNPRKKWRSSSSPRLAVGDVVLLEEENQQSLRWPLGRIIEVFPGSDGAVRVATVQTSKGCFKRSVTKLYPLPREEEIKNDENSAVLNGLSSEIKSDTVQPSS